MKDRLAITIVLFLLIIVLGGTITIIQVVSEKYQEVQAQIDELNKQIAIKPPSAVPDSLNRIEALARENEQLRTENAALNDYIKGFNISEDQKYNYKRLQENYLKSQK